MPLIHAAPLTEFISALFIAADTHPAHAQRVAQSLVSANLAGHDSHGIIRTIQYLDGVEDGSVNAHAVPTIARQTGVVSMVDGGAGFGQVAAHFAMNIAIDSARQHGMSTVGLYNSGHVGRIGEWAQLAADQQMIGLVFCSGGGPGGLVTPHGGMARRLGTNPIAAAIPLANQPPIVVDLATSVVAEGKVRVARNSGLQLRDGCILDSNGTPSIQPDDLYADGMLLPVGEHKGFCLSLMMAYLGGILTGNKTAVMPGFKRGNGVLFMALSIEAFRPLDEFMADGADLANVMHATPARSGFDEVLLPGEPERRTTAEREANGIPVDETTWSQLAAVGERYGVKIPAEFR